MILGSLSRSNTRILTGREPDQATLEQAQRATHRVQFVAAIVCARAESKSRRICWSKMNCPQRACFCTGLYSTAFGRLPRFAELETDRAVIVNQKGELEAVRMALANAFVERAEFKRKFPATMKPAEFVDTLAYDIGPDYWCRFRIRAKFIDRFAG